MTKHNNVDALLGYLRKVEDPSTAFVKSITRWVIWCISSAAIERDFNCMRQIMESASSQLSTWELNRRLRLCLIAPDVILTPNAKTTKDCIHGVMEILRTKRGPPEEKTKTRGRPRCTTPDPKGNQAKHRKQVISGKVFDTEKAEHSVRIRNTVIDLDTDDPGVLLAALEITIEKASNTFYHTP